MSRAPTRPRVGFEREVDGLAPKWETTAGSKWVACIVTMLDGSFRAVPTIMALMAVAALVSGCGGGGSSSPDPAPAPSPAPAPQPTGPNQAPIVIGSIPDQVGGARRPFSLDVSRFSVFSDPDGDALTYTRTTGPLELSFAGPVLSGVLSSHVGSLTVTVVVNDGRGGTASVTFMLDAAPNGAPVVASPNLAVLVSPGTQILYDATKVGGTFADPEQDRLSYELVPLSATRGLGVDGTRIVGALTGPGVVRFELKATDAFGATALDRFSVAATAPEPPDPVLPRIPYVYADQELDLPMVFGFAVSNARGVFWDTQPEDNRITNDGATLGRALFYDKRLSVTNTHSCGSCHFQANGFGSPLRFDIGVLGTPLKRHSMTLANSRFNIAEHWFSDLRATPLEALALLPIEDPIELGSYLQQVETKLAATRFYPALFEAAFGSRDITAERIGLALGQFLRAMMSYQSRFDAAYTGEVVLENLLTATELRGKMLFETDAGKCHFCHGERVQVSSEARNNGLDATITDPGVVTLQGPTGRFRAASLRNIAVSAPYMHDGRFATLREVIDHYDHGVQENRELDQILRDSSLFSDEPQRLNLSEEDKLALEAFLHTLTDDAFLTDPKFSDPFP